MSTDRNFRTFSQFCRILRGIGIDARTACYYDYERAKQFILGLNVDSKTRQLLLEWAIRFTGI